MADFEKVLTGHERWTVQWSAVRARLASAEVDQRAGVRADRRPLHSPALVTREDFLKIGHFAPFSQFLHIKGLNFPDVFIRSRLPMTPMNHEKFHGNRSAHRTFSRNPKDRHTDRQTRQLYVLYIYIEA